MGERALNKTSSKNKKTKKFLIPLAGILILALFAFGAYYFTSYQNNSGYINSLYSEKQKIDKANSQVGEVFKDLEQIDSKNAEEISNITKTLSSSEAMIQEALTELKTVAPMAKYKEQYDNYVKGIETNKKVFTQTVLILENPVHKDIDKAVESLYGYVTDSAQLYDKSKIGKSSIVLPDEVLTIPDKISQFVNVEKIDFEAKSRIIEQYSKYFTDMDKIISSLRESKTDLSLNFDQIKSNRTTLENVYLVIEKKLMALNDIKTSFDKISVPPKSIANHEQLGNVIKGYMDYCEEFKSNLIQFEEAGSDNDKLMNVNQIFEQLKKQYKNLDSSFGDFNDKYNDDKSSYGDMDNI